VSPTFSSLKVHNYRLYAGGMLVSNTGTWMQRVGQDWLVLQLTHNSGTALGITTGLQFLPMLLFSLWGGVLADRYPKRRVLLLTQTLMAMTALVLGGLVLSGAVETWHVYLLAFALGTATSIDNPARQAFVVEMVGPEEMTNAVGLNSASFNAGRLLGPAVAGLLIGWLGTTGPVFMINAVSFAAVIAALLRMRPDELTPSRPAERSPGQVREGLRYVAIRPDLLAVIAVVFVVGTFGFNFQMTTALMATQVFHKGPREFGLLGSIMAVGSLTGALFAARRGQPLQRLVLGAAAAFGLLEVAAGLMPTYLTFAAALVPVGVAALTFATSANATVQLSVDPAMRGRVMAVYMAVFMGGTPLGSPFLGWLAEVAGARWSLAVGGGLSTAAAVAAAAWLARRRGLSVRARVRPRPALTVRPVRRAGAAARVRG